MLLVFNLCSRDPFFLVKTTTYTRMEKALCVHMPWGCGATDPHIRETPRSVAWLLHSVDTNLRRGRDYEKYSQPI